MNRPRNISILSILILSLAFTFQAVYAHGESESGSYKILTHLVVGSHDAKAAKPLEEGLSTALNTVRNDFRFSSYSLEETHFHSLGSGGNISFQSMLRKLGSLKAVDNPIFSEWSYGGFTTGEGDSGPVGFKSFRFQARVPVKYSGVENDANSSSFVKYEFLKLALNNIEMEIGKPTLIASLPMPENGESLFFIIEVRQSGRP